MSNETVTQRRKTGIKPKKTFVYAKGGREVHGLHVAACRTILDALGSKASPLVLAEMVRYANRAFAVGHQEDYNNELAAIRGLLELRSNDESRSEQTEG